MAHRGIPRPHVRTPDGRTFFGQWLQNLSEANGETPYIQALAMHVRGVAEVNLPAGRADVATNSLVFEVEPASQWRVGARQAFAYGGMTGLRPALAVFGAVDLLPLYLRIRDRMPPLALWVWTHGLWESVDSRRVASRLVCPTPLAPLLSAEGALHDARWSRIADERARSAIELVDEWVG